MRFNMSDYGGWNVSDPRRSTLNSQLPTVSRAIGRAAVLCACLLAAAVQTGAAAEPDAEPAPPPVDAMRERILASLALKPGMVVAEIGLGRGWFVFRAAEAVGKKGIVYGTDIDPEAIAAMRQQQPHINPAAGRVDLRLCRDGRDTALDDLPNDRVDVVLMVDSLCFDAREPRPNNVAYLRRFLRILRPGGRLVHHMDCQCDIAPEGVIAQFTDAGFSPHVETVDAPPFPAAADPDGRCQSEAAHQRHAFIGVFRKAMRNDRHGSGRRGQHPLKSSHGRLNSRTGARIP